MTIALLRNLSISTHKLVSPQIFPKPKPNVSPPPFSPISSTCSRVRFLSTSDTESPPNPETIVAESGATESSVAESGATESSVAETEKKVASLVGIEDVCNKDLKLLIKDYFKKGEEEALPTMFSMLLKRTLKGKHAGTDNKLAEEFRRMPVNSGPDKKFEIDFDELYHSDSEHDEAFDNMCNAEDFVKNKMVKAEYKDNKKLDDMINKTTEQGSLKDTRDCEEILEDMMNWDKLLPDEMKEKVKQKHSELEGMCDRGELEREQAAELYKEFEDQMIVECQEMMAAEGPLNFDESTDSEADKNVHIDDLPGEGPILRWVSRAVFVPGGDAWHPKNRKVKMAVTVTELGLSKHQLRRLKELVGKRYHPGRDELTITSERFEHREENRKDCYRTLLMLIEECGKADKLVEDARTSYVKDKLRADPVFMERLRAKTMRLRESKLVSA